VTFSLPEFNLKKKISWAFHVDDRSESSRTYDMIMGRDLLGELGIIMKFNDHKVTYSTLSSVEALIEVNMSANESQTFRYEYSRSNRKRSEMNILEVPKF
jgi:hypothetical protein